MKSIDFSRKCFDMSNMGKIPEGNRGKLEIIAQILMEICLPTGRTCIMSHCNMRFPRRNRIFPPATRMAAKDY